MRHILPQQTLQYLAFHQIDAKRCKLFFPAGHCAWAARYNAWLLTKLTPNGVNFFSLFFWCFWCKLFFSAGHCDAGSHGDAPTASPQRVTPAGGLPVRRCAVDGHALCCRWLSHSHPQQEVPWGKQPLVCV